jgi:hypothetical protein
MCRRLGRCNAVQWENDDIPVGPHAHPALLRKQTPPWCTFLHLQPRAAAGTGSAEQHPPRLGAGRCGKSASAAACVQSTGRHPTACVCKSNMTPRTKDLPGIMTTMQQFTLPWSYSTSLSSSSSMSASVDRPMQHICTLRRHQRLGDCQRVCQGAAVRQVAKSTHERQCIGIGGIEAQAAQLLWCSC